MKTHHTARFLCPVILLMLMAAGLLLVSCKNTSAQTDKYSLFENTVESGKPMAFGDDRDIYVFCDESNWKAINQALQANLEQEVTLVVPEKYFTLKRVNIRDLETLIKYKNLLFIGDLTSKDPVSRHIRNTMPDKMKSRVKSTGGDLFLASNRWSNDQLVVYLVGKDTAGLLEINQIQSKNMYAAFVKRLSERLAYQTYKTKVIQPEFFAQYPFSMKIPENYKLYADDKKGRFLSFLYRIGNESKDYPDKYISVYHEYIPFEQLNQEWVTGVRTYIAKKYYEGDEFDPQSVIMERINFGKYPAWKITGAWKNPTLAVGGAFQSIAFYDQAQKQAYLIDNTVYFPAGDKLPLLLELQKVSESFRTK